MFPQILYRHNGRTSTKDCPNIAPMYEQNLVFSSVRLRYYGGYFDSCGTDADVMDQCYSTTSDGTEPHLIANTRDCFTYPIEVYWEEKMNCFASWKVNDNDNLRVHVLMTERTVTEFDASDRKVLFSKDEPFFFRCQISRRISEQKYEQYMTGNACDRHDIRAESRGSMTTILDRPRALEYSYTDQLEKFISTIQNETSGIRTNRPLLWITGAISISFQTTQFSNDTFLLMSLTDGNRNVSTSFFLSEFHSFDQSVLRGTVLTKNPSRCKTNAYSIEFDFANRNNATFTLAEMSRRFGAFPVLVLTDFKLYNPESNQEKKGENNRILDLFTVAQDEIKTLRKIYEEKVDKTLEKLRENVQRFIDDKKQKEL